MIKKLLFRWINPELQRQNQALIRQIDCLVEEKHELLRENGNWGKLVVELENEIIELRKEYVWEARTLSHVGGDVSFLAWKIRHLELTIERLTGQKPAPLDIDK